MPSKANDENAPQQQQQPRLIGKTSNVSSSKALATKSTNATNATATTAAAGSSKGAVQPRRALGDVSNAIRVKLPLSLNISRANERATSKGAVDRAAKEKGSTKTSKSSQPQLPSSTSAGFSRLTIGNGRSSRPPSRADAPSSDAAHGLGITGAKTHHAEGAVLQDEVEIVVQAPSSAAKKRTADEEFGNLSRTNSPDHKVRIVDFDDDVDDRVLPHQRDEEDEEVEEEEEEGDLSWVHPTDEAKQELREIKREFEEQLDYWDTTMVAEYSDEIFEYMAELEVKSMPNPRYMDHQTEIEWSVATAFHANDQDKLTSPRNKVDEDDVD